MIMMIAMTNITMTAIMKVSMKNEEEEEGEVEEEEDSEFMPGLFGSHNGDGDYTALQLSVQQRIIFFLGERIDHQKIGSMSKYVFWLKLGQRSPMKEELQRTC